MYINYVTTYSNDFSIENLPQVRKIERIKYLDKSTLSLIFKKKVIIFIAQHSVFSDELLQAIDQFCLCYNAVVVCDQTSNYRGKYRVIASLSAAQQIDSSLKDIELIIHTRERVMVL